MHAGKPRYRHLGRFDSTPTGKVIAMFRFKRPSPSAMLLLILSATAMPAAAHHSKAMFDDSKCLTLEGTVRNFEWQYPHSWLWIIVPTTEGAGDIWAFESMSPSQLVEVDPRWTHDVVAVGDK